MLNGLLSAHRLGLPRLRLSLDGRQLPASAYLQVQRDHQGTPFSRVSTAGMSAALSNGATLVLDAVDEMHPPVGDGARSLAHIFGDHVGVNAYAGWSDRAGFGTHWDDHDVFVVQVAGEKAWTILGDGPQDRFDANASAPVQSHWSGLLRDGSVLYIPRGWWHEARMTGEPSLHLTFSVSNPTGAEYLAWLQARLARALPIAADLPQFATATSRKQHEAALHQALVAEMQVHGIDAFLADRARTNQPAGSLSLPYSLGVGEAIDDTLSIGAAVTLPGDMPRAPDGTARLHARGASWNLSPEAVSVMSLLADGSAHSVAAIRAQLGPAMAPDLVAPLISFLLAQELITIRKL